MTGRRTDMASMPDKRDEVSIPVIAEEANASTRQVVTGDVRVTKTVVPHEEIIEQELIRNSAEIR
jgi:stress response protein YsnF